jgi:hypothetical protein
MMLLIFGLAKDQSLALHMILKGSYQSGGWMIGAEMSAFLSV